MTQTFLVLEKKELVGITDQHVLSSIDGIGASRSLQRPNLRCVGSTVARRIQGLHLVLGGVVTTGD